MRPIRILLIEDDLDSGDAMCLLLRKEDARVDWAPTAEKAIARYRRDPEFDLIFVDLMLPEMDGATLIERLSEIAPLPAVVIHTAASTATASEAARRIRGATILRKPTDWGAMRAILDRYRPVATGTASPGHP
ncbi:MAG TPA: response regulator [Candidatus Eisenbacteria bacterium]|nr:response regulator [Candidatus Eisenbacteria bacterium]